MRVFLHRGALPLLLCLFAILAWQPARAQDGRLAGFDEYAAQALRDWEVPGAGIAVLKDGRIALSRGYGVRTLGQSAPVTDRTLFAIGSTSKAFTAAAVGMLVDEGKLSWDDPVTKHLPGFQMYDPYVTRELTVRDLLTHRSGLERGDLLWGAFGHDRDELVRRMRYFKPTWSLRSTFGYQNLMYLTAGQVAARIAGSSWDEIVRTRIFAPLGMKTSNTSVSRLADLSDVATPHTRADGKVESHPYRVIDNIGPAGSINSSAAELIEWVRLHLDGGKAGDRQLLSPAVMKEMHAPQTIIPNAPPWSMLCPDAHFISYGLGWILADYRGRKVVMHTGNIDGMSALVAMLPEERLGLVVLTNMNGTMMPTALAYKVFDLFLGASARDWSAEMLKTVKAQLAQAPPPPAQTAGTSPTLKLDEYAGVYANDYYGEVRIALADGRLTMQLGSGLRFGLSHWHYDAFQAVQVDRAANKALVNFTLNAAGKPETVRLNMRGLNDLLFHRANPPAR